MKRIVEKVFGRVFGKSRKFFPVVNERGIAEKPKKFYPATEGQFLLEQRRQGIFGNGTCVESF